MATPLTTGTGGALFFIHMFFVPRNDMVDMDSMMRYFIDGHGLDDALFHDGHGLDDAAFFHVLMRSRAHGGVSSEKILLVPSKG